MASCAGSRALLAALLLALSLWAPAWADSGGVTAELEPIRLEAPPVPGPEELQAAIEAVEEAGQARLRFRLTSRCPRRLELTLPRGLPVRARDGSVLFLDEDLEVELAPGQSTVVTGRAVPRQGSGRVAPGPCSLAVEPGLRQDSLALRGQEGGGNSGPVEPPPAAGNRLEPDQGLAPGQSLRSPNGFYQLIMQGDGNLVLYRAGRTAALWSSGTQGKAGARAAMQGDGNLVIYLPSGRPVWSSGTQGHAGAFLVLQDDGNVVLYEPAGRALWSTGTDR
jgi:hypothetical protein